MKKTILLLVFIMLSLSDVAAQYAGKEFIMGNAALNVSSSRNRITNSSDAWGGFSADVSKGKFVTDQKATGFRLSGGLDFSSASRNGQPQYGGDNGIRTLSLGAGKFWQYYKHFGDTWGIFGEPSVNAGYSFGRSFQSTSENVYNRTNSHAYEIGLSLRAGAYYQLSPKWWLNASLGFSNPVSVSFQHSKTVDFSVANDQPLSDGTKTRELNYRLVPGLNLPSVGLGLTYFIR